MSRCCFGKTNSFDRDFKSSGIEARRKVAPATNPSLSRSQTMNDGCYKLAEGHFVSFNLQGQELTTDNVHADYIKTVGRSKASGGYTLLFVGGEVLVSDSQVQLKVLKPFKTEVCLCVCVFVIVCLGSVCACVYVCLCACACLLLSVAILQMAR